MQHPCLLLTQKSVEKRAAGTTRSTALRSSLRPNSTAKLPKNRIRTYINDHLKANPCVDCGETDIVVLEFDHVGEAGTKHFSISDATRSGYGMAKIKAEIAKCEVRCANCHRKKTYERGGWTHKG
jgi:hypothetical protein